MDSCRTHSMAQWLLGCSALIFILVAGCTPQAGQTTPDANQESRSENDTVGSMSSELKQGTEGGCPAVETAYILWFSHKTVMHTGSEAEGIMHLEFENIPPSYFSFWIDPAGKASNTDIIDSSQIGYDGYSTHPGSNDCPMQIFQGTWKIEATITGSCRDGIVRIHVVEEWVNPVLKSSCGDATPGPGMFSAPELDLTFDLQERAPMDGINVGQEGGVFYASYVYQLNERLGSPNPELPVEPLVPPD
jgi:hypothetical protein